MEDRGVHCWSKNSQKSCTYGVSKCGFDHVDWRNKTRKRWRRKQGKTDDKTEPQASQGIFITLGTHDEREGGTNLGIWRKDWRCPVPHHIGNLASLLNAFRCLAVVSNNSSVAWHLLECLVILITVSGNLIKASGIVVERLDLKIWIWSWWLPSLGDLDTLIPVAMQLMALCDLFNNLKLTNPLVDGPELFKK